MTILRAALLVIFLISGMVTGGLAWSRFFGDCADGCAEGMVFILFMPALVVVVLSAAALASTYIFGRKSSGD